MEVIDYITKYANEIEQSLERSKYMKFHYKIFLLKQWKHSVYERAYVLYINDYIDKNQYMQIIRWVRNSMVKDFMKTKEIIDYGKSN